MQRAAIPLGRIAGVSLCVHWLVPVLLGAILVRTALLAPERLTLTALALTAAVILLLAHELAHALMARRLGLPLGPIVLGPLFNASLLRQEPQRPRDEILIAGAGPLANLLLCGLLAGTQALARDHVPPEIGAALRLATWISLVMGLGNLLPAFPLDGGRMLRALLGLRQPWLLASRMAGRIGNLVAIAVPLVALLNDSVRSSPLLWGGLTLLAIVLVRAGQRQELFSVLRELRLQMGQPDSEVPQDLRDVLGPAEPVVEHGYRPLSPARFRTWQKTCEETARRLLGLGKPNE